MNNSINEQLASLPSLGKTALYELWKELFGQTYQPELRKDLMIPLLAYRLQEKAHGSISIKSKRRLNELSRMFETNSYARSTNSPTIKPGTRLVRQWKNRTHVVHVAEKGYEYDGIQYKSLSEIARLITGTRWSGPLFFGLKKPHELKEEKK